MKTTLLRYTLAMLFCLSTDNGWGQVDYIINEDFSSLYISGNTRTCGEWTLSNGCVYGYNVDNDNKALRIEDYSNNTITGWAMSPYFEYTGDAYLTFSYARGKTTGTSTIEIKLTEGVVFDNNTNLYYLTVEDGSQRETFKTISLKIHNATETTRFRIMEGALGNTFVIDNVKVTKIPEVSISEALDNSTTISTNDTKMVTVNTTRTLTGGIWNTMCLPFNVTMNDMVLALGTNQDIQLRTFSSYNNNVISFANANATTIPAGTPFLIKLNTTVVNPTFHSVTICNTEAKSIGEEGSVRFVGTYNPIDLATDGTNLFLTTRNTLASPASDKNRMNGMRAYIVVPSGFNPSNARIMMDDGETTAISLMPSVAEATPRATYNLKGQRIEKARRGLYVVNGKLTLVK